MTYSKSFRSQANYLTTLRALVPRSRQSKSGQKPVRSTYHPNADSWLSSTDTTLLLRKQAGDEAKKGNHITAVKILSHLIVREPTNPENLVNRGLMYSNLGRGDDALADYNRAIELNPKFDRAFSNRGNLHAIRHNWQDAIADYDEAIDLNPLNIRARLNQAVTFREMGNYEEALICLDIALFFRPKSAVLYAERGRTYHLQGYRNRAIAAYTTACHLAEDSSLKDISSPTKVIRRVLSWTNSLNSCSQ
ncbi:tetratricopeptide repeat domain protein [Synechococcus sp. PCC 7335]|uniref:tetratricopeptide repeat protein n=1 Tax=Synechococcus sp. (strain ATCC 29403 / PCC 7335) TaxID=91464 RepID=UPI00017EC424|nr:tetratricopeptide repeat protein [Synechococcus sp. PCC 7335]EDX85026.1 tetratricopeptide repeat domain protein [Synechococcus sp. PCC 7335]